MGHQEIGENCVMGRFISCTLPIYYKSNEIEHGVGGACSTHGRWDIPVEYCQENLKEETGLKTGRRNETVLKCIFNK
jgi:hypothetical protein